MLNVRLFVNGKEIGEMNIINTGKKTEDGAALYTVQQSRTNQKLDRNGKPVIVKHERKDGPWNLVARAIAAYSRERNEQQQS